MKYPIIQGLGIIIVCGLIAGCASKWQNTVNNEENFTADKYKCEQEVQELYPSQEKQKFYPLYSRGMRDISSEKLQNNATKRNKTFQSCMDDLGWKLIY